MTAQTFSSLRPVFGLAAAGAMLLCAPGAFAQATPSPYSFQVENDTLSPGDPVFSVADDLTFSNLQVNETFAGGFTQTVLLPSLDTLTIDEQTNLFVTNYPLISAVLTGSIGPGPTQTVDVATTFGGATTPELVSSTFSASLFGPAVPGFGLGQFSLLDGSGNVASSVVIEAAPAVPETSTVVSLGLLLALGLGGLIVTRRRTAASTL